MNIKGMNRTRPKTINYHNNKLFDKKEVADTFGFFFQSNNSNENYDIHFLSYKTMVENTSPINYEIKNPDNLINDPLTITEFNNCLFKKKSKSLGPDGIPFSFLQHLSSLSLNYLLNIFNNIWTKNHFPKQLKAATIIPIPKPNKTIFDINNYRPISLFNTMSKILENMDNTRPLWFLETQNFPSPPSIRFSRQPLHHQIIDNNPHQHM
jgi:hypothetical protein